MKKAAEKPSPFKLNYASGAADQLWLMTGDFNAISSVDNFHNGKDPGSTEFLVHDYILRNTPYLDLVHERFPGEILNLLLFAAAMAPRTRPQDFKKSRLSILTN